MREALKPFLELAAIGAFVASIYAGGLVFAKPHTPAQHLAEARP